MKRWNNNIRERKNCDEMSLIYLIYKLLNTLILTVYETEV